MENYEKSASSEAPEVHEPLHSIELDANVIHMNVKVGSKTSNLTGFAFKRFKEADINQITWNGSGDALCKVVACAEIMKAKFKNLYQINKIGFCKCEEIWKSKLEGLKDIKVTKEIPSMCIILSKKPLESNERGYQSQETLNELLHVKKTSKNRSVKKSTGSSQLGDNSNKSVTYDEDVVHVKKKRMPA